MISRTLRAYHDLPRALLASLHGVCRTLFSSNGGLLCRNSWLTPFLWSALGVVFAAVPLAAQGGEAVRIIQTNSAGTNAHVIDPVTNEVVGVIEGVLRVHGVAVHPDGLYYYFSDEMRRTIDVVDTRTLKVVEYIPLTDVPNNVALSKKLRKLYVGIRGAPYTDVIDIDTHELIKSIRMQDGVHNIYLTKDNRYAVASLGSAPNTPGGPSIEVIDTSTDEVIWGIPVEGNRTRPLAIESHPDGSPKRIFAQATNLHGFFVIDWNSREVVDFISPPPVPISRITADARQNGPSHGLEVLSDGSAVWAVSRLYNMVHGYSLPDLEYIGGVFVGFGGGGADWATSSPDGRFLYVSVTGANETVVIDLERLEVVKRVPVGQAPKRVHTAVIPAERVEIGGTNH
jgi:YVTN family beta-propeller protein